MAEKEQAADAGAEKKEEEKERCPGWHLMTPTQQAMAAGWEDMEKADDNIDPEDREQLCKYFEESNKLLIEAMAAMPTPDDWKAGVTMETKPADGKVPEFTVIKPEGAEGPLPCIVYIHGGGMCMLTGKETWDLVSNCAWVRQHNVVLVSIHFRNSYLPGCAFPAGLDDCVACVEHVTANAEALGIDMSKGGVTLYGPSGGGNLVITTAMRLKGKGLVNGVAANCPAVQGWEDAEKWPSTVKFMPADHKKTGWWWAKVYTEKKEDETNPFAWPCYATKEDLTDLPPFLLQISDCDCLYDGGKEFFYKLMDAGVAAQCRVSMGSGHCGDLMEPDLIDYSRAEIGVFMKQCQTKAVAKKEAPKEEEAAKEG